MSYSLGHWQFQLVQTNILISKQRLKVRNNETKSMKWKNQPANAGGSGDVGSIPGLGRFTWKRKWLPITVFLHGKSHGQRSLVGYSPWSPKESDMYEWLAHTYTHTHTHTHTPGSGQIKKPKSWITSLYFPSTDTFHN